MRKGKTGTQLHLEGLVAKLVEKFPLPRNPVQPGEMEGLAVALRIPCLLWNRGKNSVGYGVMYLCGPRQIYCHRWSYIISYGEIPDGLYVCHHCDTPACFNPHHLFAGTQEQNLDDMMAKGRQCKDRKVPGLKGEQHGMALFTTEQVIDMRNQFANGATVKFLQDQFLAGYHTIYAIVHRHNWKHIS